MSIAEVSRDLVRGVRLAVGVVGTLGEAGKVRTMTPNDMAAGHARSRVHLAMNSGSGRFIGLIERSAPWRPVQ
jgi:hypothetical protein